MLDLDSLTIGQVRAISDLFSNNTIPVMPPRIIEHGLQIAVLDRGFVYIGDVTTDGEWCHIANAWNIRRWGTSRGLGELTSGPLPETKLDRVGNVRLPLRTLQHLIAVEPDKWTSKLV